MLTRARSLSRESSLPGDSQSSSQSSLGDSAPQEEVCAPPKKKARRTRPPEPAQWVCLVPSEQLAQDQECRENGSAKNGPSFVSLPDPRTGLPRRFLANGSTGVLCEVMKFSDEPRSWLLGNSVQTDGSLFICTPVDPLFLVLPLVKKAGKCGKYTTLEAILDAEGVNSHLIRNCILTEQWEHICDCKVMQSGLAVFRYSPERTLNWLKKKVEVLAAALKEEGVYVGAGSVSSLLSKQRRQASTRQADFVTYACSMVCDYLQSDLASTLAKSMGAAPAEAETVGLSKKVPQDEACSKPNQANAVSSGEPFEDYTKVSTLKPTIKDTSVKKAASSKGMKSLSSFFAPKPRKS